MNGQGPVEQTGTAASGPIAADRFGCRFLDPRVPGKVKIIVRSEHQDFALAHSDLTGTTVLAPIKRFKIDVEACLLQGARAIEFPALFEDVPSLGWRTAWREARRIVHDIQLL